MPTTQPRDAGDDVEGQLKAIAEFAAPVADSGAVPAATTASDSVRNAAAAAATSQSQQPSQPQLKVQSMMNQAVSTHTRLGGPRLKNAPVQQAQPEQKVEQQLLSNEYTAEQFNNTWDNYIATHQSDHLLINTMRACRPVLLTGNNYAMTVESDIQASLVLERMADILVYLRRTLNNTNINIEIKTNQGVASPTTWNEREVYDDIKLRHPAFADFVKALDLKL